MADTNDIKTCFVIGPIGADGTDIRLEADWLLEEIIKPTLARYDDFQVVRADKVSDPGLIDSQIINLLLSAELVIADLTGLNPNAFYEIGIRHMVQKPIIHMFPPDLELPFDVKPYRSIPFSRSSPFQLQAARGALRSQIDAVLAPGFQVETPVTRARGRFQVEQHAMSGEQVLLSELDAIKSRLDSHDRLLLEPVSTNSSGFHRKLVVTVSVGDNTGDDDLERLTRLVQNVAGRPALEATFKNYELSVVVAGEVSLERQRALRNRLTSDALVEDVSIQELVARTGSRSPERT